MTDKIVHHLSSPPHTPAFNVEAHAHAHVCNVFVNVLHSETGEKARDNKTNIPLNIKSGGERGGGAHGRRSQRVLRMKKKEKETVERDTKVVHYFVLQPSFLKAAAPR